MKPKRLFSALVALVVIWLSSGLLMGAVVHNEDFNVNNGGYTAQTYRNGSGTSDWVWGSTGAGGTNGWSTLGGANTGQPFEEWLTSPTMTVGNTETLWLEFDHSFDFEVGWDGGMVQVSVNGGSFAQVTNFTRNGYDNTIQTAHNWGYAGDMNGASVFNADSGGYISSEANLGTFSSGDTIRIRFRGGWDWGYLEDPSNPDWSVDNVRVSQALFWDRDDGNAGAASSATAQGTWNATDTNWNSRSDGSGANQTWDDGVTAIFSAGSDATGSYDINVSGTRIVRSLRFEEGDVTLKNGVIDFQDYDGEINTAAGSTANIKSEIAGNSGLLLTGSGTTILSGSASNTYTGTVTVSAGTLELNKTGGADSITGDIQINGGTVLLSRSEQIADTGNIILNGGTLATDAKDETAASLTISASSTIDFGVGDADLMFDDLSYTAGLLTVTNWSGLMRYDGHAGDPGDDRLLFASASLTGYSVGDYFDNVRFYDELGAAVGTRGRFVASNVAGYVELVPVPEASTWLSLAGCLMLAAGYRKRKKL